MSTTRLAVINWRTVDLTTLDERARLAHDNQGEGFTSWVWPWITGKNREMQKNVQVPTVCSGVRSHSNDLLEERFPNCGSRTPRGPRVCLRGSANSCSKSKKKNTIYSYTNLIFISHNWFYFFKGVREHDAYLLSIRRAKSLGNVVFERRKPNVTTAHLSFVSKPNGTRGEGNIKRIFSQVSLDINHVCTADTTRGFSASELRYVSVDTSSDTCRSQNDSSRDSYYWTLSRVS